MGCPVEVHLLIIDRLPKRADLNAMTLVNKHFENITQPLLFDEVDVGWTSKEPSPITLVLRTFIEKPDLAKMVESLRLDGFEFPTRDFDILPTLSVACLNMAKAAAIIKGTGADFADAWAQSVSDGEVDAVVTLLVTILPNVKNIHLGSDYTIEVSYLTKMLSLEQRKKPGVKLPALKQLRSVMIKNEYSDMFHGEIQSTAALLNFFNLPQLKDLCMAVSPLASEEPWRPEEHVRMDALTSLDLSRASEDQLGNILSLIPHLTTLRWQGYWCPQSYFPGNLRTAIDLDKLRVALENCRHSLQRLTLEVVDMYDIRSNEPEGSIWPMRLVGMPLQLTDFANLRSLCVPFVWVMGWRPGVVTHLVDKLPRGLEHLTLTDDFFTQKYWKWTKMDVQNAVWHLVTTHYYAESTCLRELHLAGVMFRDYWDQPKRRFVGGVCRTAKIKFQVLKTTQWERDHYAESDERKRRYA
ncbi:hypothetical protein ACHAPU_007039 [Fusarium lateritium]